MTARGPGCDRNRTLAAQADNTIVSESTFSRVSPLVALKYATRIRPLECEKLSVLSGLFKTRRVAQEKKLVFWDAARSEEKTLVFLDAARSEGRKLAEKIVEKFAFVASEPRFLFEPRRLGRPSVPGNLRTRQDWPPLGGERGWRQGRVRFSELRGASSWLPSMLRESTNRRARFNF